MGPPSRHKSFKWLAFALGLTAAVFALIALAGLSAARGTPVEAEQAIRIASRRLREIDPTFHPSDHVARAFLECSISPWTVDYSRRDGGPVVARAAVERSGALRGAEFFGQELRVESYRTGRLFLLRIDGTVASEIPLPRTAPSDSRER
jgi:hypothetical protein